MYIGMITLYIYCLEDDAELSSSFMRDVRILKETLGKTKNDIRIIIRYRTHSYYTHFDIQMNSGDVVSIWKEITTIQYKRGTIIADIEQWLDASWNADSLESYLLVSSHGYNSYINVREKCYKDVPECINDKMYMGKFARLCKLKHYVFDGILLNSCCMSSIDALSDLIGVTKYVVACQSICPYLGFVCETFVETLGDVRKPVQSRMRSIARHYVKSNMHPVKRLRSFSSFTDAVVTDMHMFERFYDRFKMALNDGMIIKAIRKYRVIETVKYWLYDLYYLLMEQGYDDLAKMMKRCVKQYIFQDERTRQIMGGINIHISLTGED
jgi:hypothetical protein